MPVAAPAPARPEAGGRAVAPPPSGGGAPPGWVRDEAGRLRRETVHRMGRRCRAWDYRCDATYLITLVLADRASAALGRLVVAPPPSGGGPSEVRASVEPSPLGLEVAGLWNRMGEFTPEIEPLALQLMPDHLHGILRANRYPKRPLGAIVRGFKAGASSLAKKVGVCTESLFAPGFVDNILFDAEAQAHAEAYLADNPRRLAVKRLFPSLFQVLRDLPVAWRHPAPPGSGGLFSAIGNHFLLDRPTLLQVQCSRADFAYRRGRDARGQLVLDRDEHGEKIVAKSTPAFEERLAECLAAAEHGAVLVSPCISDGEKEIAARAFAADRPVVTLSNKGFSPLYKPGGKLFDRCAAGNLLMLAPAAWPYVPGEKRMTREDALALNRIAQWICGPGAAEVNYRGARLADVDAMAARAVARPEAGERNVAPPPSGGGTDLEEPPCH